MFGLFKKKTTAPATLGPNQYLNRESAVRALDLIEEGRRNYRIIKNEYGYYKAQVEYRKIDFDWDKHCKMRVYTIMEPAWQSVDKLYYGRLAGTWCSSLELAEKTANDNAKAYLADYENRKTMGVVKNLGKLP